MEKFVDRTKELETLEKEFCREESSFVVVYGRRRVGKTALINHFCKGKNAIYFLELKKAKMKIEKISKILSEIILITRFS